MGTQNRGKTMKYKNLFSKDSDREESDQDDEDDVLWTPCHSNKRPKKLSEVNSKMEVPSKRKVKFYIVTFLAKPCEKIDHYVCIPSTWIYSSKFIERKKQTRVAVLYPHNDGERILTNYRVRTEEKPHPNWKMYMADIIYKSETYDEAKSWITKKKNEMSSDDVATSTLSGTQLETVANKKQSEKSQINPNRILRQNRIEQPIIQLERLELASREDEETPEISDNVKLEEPVINTINEMIESSALNCDNSSEHCTTNKCRPENQSTQSNISTFLPGTCRDSKSQYFTTNCIPNDKYPYKISMLDSHLKSANLRNTQNSYKQEVCDRTSKEAIESNAKPQPDKTLDNQIKITHENNLKYPFLFIPASTSSHDNYQPQVASERDFPQVVHNQKRLCQELVANEPSSTYHIHSKINVPSQIPINTNNPPSDHFPDHSIAKKSYLESNTQRIQNIQELINKTVQKSLPVPKDTQNALQVTTTQNNIEHYFPNLSRQVNMPQISAAKSLSHLTQKSRFIDQSHGLYRPCTPQIQSPQAYQMQHYKGNRDIYKQLDVLQNIYQKSYLPPALNTAAQNQANLNIKQPENFALQIQNHYQPINKNYLKELPKLQAYPINVTKLHHNLSNQYNIQNTRENTRFTAQRSHISKYPYHAEHLKNPEDQQHSKNIQNDCLLQTARNIQNPQDIVKTHVVPSSTSLFIPQKNFEITSKGSKSVPINPLAHTEQSSNRPYMEFSQGLINLAVSADRGSDNIFGNNNHIQTRMSITNNVEKKHVRNKTEEKEQMKSRLAAEQEMLDAFSALFTEMASHLNYTTNMFNTFQSSVSEMNETYKFLEKKIDLLNSIENFSVSPKKLAVPENISIKIPDLNKDKSSDNKINKKDDASDDKNENRENRYIYIYTFVLPPEYDPKDSKWTLKYREMKPDLVELIPGSGIYVKKTNLKKILRQSTNCKTLALNLLSEIFSRNALSVCSLTGSRAKAFGSQITYVRPGLDEEAKNVLLYFVEQYAKKRSIKISRKDMGSIMTAIRGKINWCREKWGKTVRVKRAL